MFSQSFFSCLQSLDPQQTAGFDGPQWSKVQENGAKRTRKVRGCECGLVLAFQGRIDNEKDTADMADGLSVIAQQTAALAAARAAARARQTRQGSTLFPTRTHTSDIWQISNWSNGESSRSSGQVTGIFLAVCSHVIGAETRLYTPTHCRRGPDMTGAEVSFPSSFSALSPPHLHPSFRPLSLFLFPPPWSDQSIPLHSLSSLSHLLTQSLFISISLIL